MNIIGKIVIFPINSRFWECSREFPGGIPRDLTFGNSHITTCTTIASEKDAIITRWRVTRVQFNCFESQLTARFQTPDLKIFADPSFVHNEKLKLYYAITNLKYSHWGAVQWDLPYEFIIFCIHRHLRYRITLFIHIQIIDV